MDKKKDIYNLWVQYTTKVSSSTNVDPSDIPRIVAEQIVCVFLRSAIRIIADKRNMRGIEKRNWDPPVKIDKVFYESQVLQFIACTSRSTPPHSLKYYSSSTTDHKKT